MSSFSEAATCGTASTQVSRLRSLWSHEPVPFVTAYVLSGLLAVLVPAIKYRKEVRSYQNSYYYQYNQNNQNGDGNNNNNNNNNQDGNDNGSGDEYDVNNCKWWKFWCTSQWVNGNGEYQEQEQDQNGNYYTTPSWFSGWGNGNRSGDRNSGDNNATASGSLKFVYAWQTLLFLALLAYGALLLFKFRGGLAQSRMAIQSLFLLIFVWTNFCFLAMWMLANGSIYTDGREMEQVGGFYLQFSVLMFISNFWQMVWGLCFCIALGIRSCRRHNQNNLNKEDASVKTGGVSSSGYFAYCEPTISITDSKDNDHNDNSTSKKSYSYV